MVEEAGPHRGTLEVVEVRVRGHAAVVVTRGSGSNRFRSWQDETTIWLAGESDGVWRVVGFAILFRPPPP